MPPRTRLSIHLTSSRSARTGRKLPLELVVHLQFQLPQILLGGQVLQVDL